MISGLLSVAFTGYLNLGLKIIYFDFNLLNIVLLYSWDTAGQERFKCMAASYYRGAHGKLTFFLRL